MFKWIMNQNIMHSWRWFLVISLIGVVVIQFAYFYRPQAAIATVNITGMVSSFVKETAQQNLSMEEKQQKVNKFGQSMQRVMEDMAKRKHIVIMPNEAVIAGSPDLTEEVMAQIKKEMAP